MADVHFVPLSTYNWSLSDFDLLPWNPTVYCVVASFFAVALWLALELGVQVFCKFKRHKGLYFWSILIVACGVALHAIGLLLKLFVAGVNVYFSTSMAKIGWIMDTTGFAVVLYSRLHLIVRNRKTLRLVLAMIIINAIIFHTPMIVFLMGLSKNSNKNWGRYVNPFEYTQVVGFSIQETIISIIYIRKTAKFLKTGYSTQLRKVMTLLITVQVISVLIDIALLVIDTIGMFTLKAVLHPFAYAVKLKIEFAVLNSLLYMIKHDRTIGDLFSTDSDASSTPSTSTTLQGRQISTAKMRPWSWFGAAKARNEPELPMNQNNITKTMEFNVRWQGSTRHNSHAMMTDAILPERPITAAVAPTMTRLDSGSTLQADLSEEQWENSIQDVERQYLGVFGLQRSTRGSANHCDSYGQQRTTIADGARSQNGFLR